MNRANRLKILVIKIMITSLKCLEFPMREDLVYTLLIQILEKFGLKMKKVTILLFMQMEIQLKKCRLVLILTKWQKELNIKNQILQEFKMENSSKINANSYLHQSQWLTLVCFLLKVMDLELNFSIKLSYNICSEHIKKKPI